MCKQRRNDGLFTKKDILKFVTALIHNTKGEGKGGDDFWLKAETLLYQALIGYIYITSCPKPTKNINTLVEMINSMEIREDDENFKNPVDILFDEPEKKNPEHFAVRQYAKYSLAAGKT
jgi:type IV secretion system protein VirD4